VLSDSAFLYATFPRPTETFVRRELRELKKLGFTPDLFSIWKGQCLWEGRDIRLFSISRLFFLLVWIPYWAWRKPKGFKKILTHLWSSPCPNFQNWNETFLGLAFALVEAKKFERLKYRRIHAVWATMPATAALGFHILTDVPYSMGAHAYDVFRHQGDWLLSLKLKRAVMVRTSSASTARRLTKFGVNQNRLILIHRSLNPMSTRTDFSLVHKKSLSLVSVGRLIEKKGYFLLLKILEDLRARKVPFTLDILGEGPLRKELTIELSRRHLDRFVCLHGHCSEDDIISHYRKSDALLFTGVIASNGDRDGIPNVIPEAMSCGLLVLASNRAGSSEAFTDQESGYSLDPYKPSSWSVLLEDFYTKPDKFNQVRKYAFLRANQQFSAKVNCKKLKYLFDQTFA